MCVRVCVNTYVTVIVLIYDRIVNYSILMSIRLFHCFMYSYLLFCDNLVPGTRNSVFSIDVRKLGEMDYVGDVNDKGEKHGVGLFKYKNGDIYEGVCAYL